MNISNEFTFGAEWEENNMTVQLVNIKGTVLLSSARWPTNSPDTMITGNVEDPERFGMTVPPRDYEEFCLIVAAYRAAPTCNTSNTVVYCQDGTTRGLR